MSGVSNTAGHGFTIKDRLARLKIELNLPAFLEGRGQIPPIDVQGGCSIASLRNHVEGAIDQMKRYRILTYTFPLKMARIANQIVTVRTYLTNLQPALDYDKNDSSDNDESFNL